MPPPGPMDGTEPLPPAPDEGTEAPPPAPDEPGEAAPPPGPDEVGEAAPPPAPDEGTEAPPPAPDEPGEAAPPPPGPEEGGEAAPPPAPDADTEAPPPAPDEPGDAAPSRPVPDEEAEALSPILNEPGDEPPPVEDPGAPGDEPPGEDPPAPEEPSADKPTVEDPPAPEDPPAEEPPAEEPPAEEPPVEEPPVEEPPVEQPPDDGPPVEDPPAPEDPPAEEPPVEQPPEDEHPVEDPPTPEDPPAEEPPVEEPPDEEPPDDEPPIDDPLEDEELREDETDEDDEFSEDETDETREEDNPDEDESDEDKPDPEEDEDKPDPEEEDEPDPAEVERQRLEEERLGLEELEAERVRLEGEENERINRESGADVLTESQKDEPREVDPKPESALEKFEQELREKPRNTKPIEAIESPFEEKIESPWDSPENMFGQPRPPAPGEAPGVAATDAPEGEASEGGPVQAIDFIDSDQLRDPALHKAIDAEAQDILANKTPYEYPPPESGLPNVPIYGDLSDQRRSILEAAIEKLPDQAFEHLEHVDAIMVVDLMPGGLNVPAFAKDGIIWMRASELDSALGTEEILLHEMGHCVDQAHGGALSDDSTPFGKGYLPDKSEWDCGEHGDFPSRYASHPAMDASIRASEDFAECYRVVCGNPDRIQEDLENEYAKLAEEHGVDWSNHVTTLHYKYETILNLIGRSLNLPS